MELHNWPRAPLLGRLIVLKPSSCAEEVDAEKEVGEMRDEDDEDDEDDADEDEDDEEDEEVDVVGPQLSPSNPVIRSGISTDTALRRGTADDNDDEEDVDFDDDDAEVADEVFASTSSSLCDSSFLTSSSSPFETLACGISRTSSTLFFFLPAAAAAPLDVLPAPCGLLDFSSSSSESLVSELELLLFSESLAFSVSVSVSEPD